MSTTASQYKLDKMQRDNLVRELSNEQSYDEEGFEDNNPIGVSTDEEYLLSADATAKVAEQIYEQVEDDRLTPDEAGKVFADIMEYGFGSDSAPIYEGDIEDVVEHAVWRDNSDALGREEGFLNSRRDNLLNPDNFEDRDAQKRAEFARGVYENEGSVWDDTEYTAEDVGKMTERMMSEADGLFADYASFDFETNRHTETSEDRIGFGATGMVFAELVRDLQEEGSVRQSDMDALMIEASKLN